MKRTLLPSRRLRCGYFGWNKCPHQPECQTCISMLTFPKLNFPVKAAPSPNSNTSSFIVAKELLPPDARRIYRNPSWKSKKKKKWQVAVLLSVPSKKFGFWKLRNRRLQTKWKVRETHNGDITGCRKLERPDKRSWSLGATRSPSSSSRCKENIGKKNTYKRCQTSGTER